MIPFEIIWSYPPPADIGFLLQLTIVTKLYPSTLITHTRCKRSPPAMNHPSYSTQVLRGQSLHDCKILFRMSKKPTFSNYTRLTQRYLYMASGGWNGKWKISTVTPERFKQEHYTSRQQTFVCSHHKLIFLKMGLGVLPVVKQWHVSVGMKHDQVFDARVIALFETLSN